MNAPFGPASRLVMTAPGEGAPGSIREHAFVPALFMA